MPIAKSTIPLQSGQLNQTHNSQLNFKLTTKPNSQLYNFKLLLKFEMAVEERKCLERRSLGRLVFLLVRLVLICTQFNQYIKFSGIQNVWRQPPRWVPDKKGVFQYNRCVIESRNVPTWNTRGKNYKFFKKQPPCWISDTGCFPVS